MSERKAYQITVDDAAIERVANALSEHSGMKFDGFWSRVEDLGPEDRADALAEARAAISALIGE